MLLISKLDYFALVSGYEQPDSLERFSNSKITNAYVDLKWNTRVYVCILKSNYRDGILTLLSRESSLCSLLNIFP